MMIIKGSFFCHFVLLNNSNVIFKKKIFFFIVLLPFLVNPLYGEEEEILLQSLRDQIQVVINDIKTLEKAVYQKSDITSSTSAQSSGLDEDVLTKHLLKLNEIEDQFRQLTNKFEEVNFKLDKLSSRVTKIQSDNQMRFSDLENSNTQSVEKKRKLPGSSKPKDFGANPGYTTKNLPTKQETNSIESAQTVITEEPEKKSLVTK